MKHCNLCGRAVAEKEYRVFTRRRRPDAKGLTICVDCQRRLPRCLVCQTPMPADRLSPGSVDISRSQLYSQASHTQNELGSEEFQQNLGICHDCLREGLHCRGCGKRITGEFLLVNGNDGPYCADCFRSRAPCDVCGAPAGEGSLLLPDRRIVCQRCRATAITDPHEANALFERVIDLLSNSLGLRLNIRPQLALVDHARLAELSRHAAHDEHDRDKVMGLFVRNGRKRFIYLQEYLPRILLIQIVAHEFAHAWQAENSPLLDDALAREGFAEWVAYHALLELDAQKKAAQMTQRRDDYGEGLRKMLALEKQYGAAAVLQACRIVQ